jgi:hypothetical protein
MGNNVMGFSRPTFNKYGYDDNKYTGSWRYVK